MSFFPNQINGLQPSHTSPKDGSAVFASNVTITLSGFPFTVADTTALILYIMYKPTGGEWQQPLMNGINGVSITSSSNVLTVAGAGTPFASNDTYFIGILETAARQRGYDTSSDSVKGFEVAPIWSQYVSESLVDTTNVSAATHDYLVPMGGYGDYSISGKFIDADGTLTLKVYMMNDEDTSGGDWVQVYGYDDKNNVTTNVWTVTNGTLTFAISFNSANYTHVKNEVVASGATNTVILKSRKKAL